ncbi:hypothetical protein L596_010294 [Steinernema carpocapsae]|uniref:RNA polymerase Rpb4/RPC9 core domain-containing protein n=1 Tax=Steinernema carpocapsae TaxID=34508 RepID=A0A4V6A6V5_STECR|nr:hypothetical protein L596_010294 [Steinernema carpocapsae]
MSSPTFFQFGNSAAPEADLEPNAAELIFPKHFEADDCETLVISEVNLLLQCRHDRALAKETLNEEFNEIQQKTLTYVRCMAKFKNRESIRDARQVFANHQMHEFEIAQLLNLCPETAEEAFALIPSLMDRVSENDLDELLKELHNKMTFH